MTNDEYENWCRRNGVPRPPKSTFHRHHDALAEIVALIPFVVMIGAIIALVS
jgi:hypothetical protein